MKRQDKIQRLKESLPFFWNSYQHMYDVREKKSQEIINFLLIISTFLPILSVTLFTSGLFSNIIILFPIIPQISSIILLLRGFVINTSVHWFKLNWDFLSGLEDEGFEKDFISQLKVIEDSTWRSMILKGETIKKSRYLIIFSLFSLLLSILFILLHGEIYIYIITFILVWGFSYLLIIYFSKPIDLSGYKSKEQYIKIIDDWLNEAEAKKGEIRLRKK